MFVKPLKPKTTVKEITEPVNTGKKDEKGFVITDTKVTKKEVPCEFQEGIILSMPVEYGWLAPDGTPMKDEYIPKVGDHVIFNIKSVKTFDCFGSSLNMAEQPVLLNPYNIVATIPQA
jgi:hypothetical protein